MTRNATPAVNGDFAQWNNQKMKLGESVDEFNIWHIIWQIYTCQDIPGRNLNTTTRGK